MNLPIKPNSIMRFVLGAIGAFGIALPAQAASFDCSKASTKVERIICDSPEISKLDDELSTAYKAALKYQERADFIRRDQGKWLNKRNRCVTPDCVKRLYEMQLLILPSPLVGNVVASEGNKPGGNAAASEAKLNKESFKLINGKGVKVCDAYEKNVNAFINPGNKYYQINPEFSELSKPDSTPLNTPPDSNIYAETYELVWARDISPASFFSHTYWHGTKEEYRKAEDEFFHANANMTRSRDLIKADIDNDGTSENVILATFCGGCGYLMFVAQDDLLGLDYAKTRLLIRHPTVAERGILRAYVAGEWKLPDSIASSEVTVVEDSAHAADYGIFAHEGKNYFYMMWNEPHLLQKDGRISSDYRANRLHVFLAEKKTVKEVCTYQLVLE